VLILTKIVEFSGDFRPKWPFLDPFLDPLFHPFCRPAKGVIYIRLKGQKWPFRCHLAGMVKRGQKRGPKNGQKGYFGTLRVYPLRILPGSSIPRIIDTQDHRYPGSSIPRIIDTQDHRYPGSSILRTPDRSK
jgi:hypothetical protein